MAANCIGTVCRVLWAHIWHHEALIDVTSWIFSAVNALHGSVTERGADFASKIRQNSTVTGLVSFARVIEYFGAQIFVHNRAAISQINHAKGHFGSTAKTFVPHELLAILL